MGWPKGWPFLITIRKSYKMTWSKKQYEEQIELVQKVHNLYYRQKYNLKRTAEMLDCSVDKIRRMLLNMQRSGGVSYLQDKYRKIADSRKLRDDTNCIIDVAPPMQEANDYGQAFVEKLPECVLIIPDLQAPYHLPDALQFLKMVADKYNPDAVLCIGDEVDFNFLSTYEKEPLIDEPNRELEQAQEFMGKLFKQFPKAHALTSNHVHGRLHGARKQARLLPQMLTKWEDLVGAPRTWAWYEEVRMGDVLFRHGDKWPTLTMSHLSRAIPDKYGCQMSVMHGHVHSKIGVQAVMPYGDDEYWAAYTGCLMSPRSRAADYCKAMNLKLGTVVIKHGVVHKIPYRRDLVTMAWTGRLERD